jgi:hypothetical protein
MSQTYRLDNVLSSVQNVIHGAMELTNIDSIIDLIEQTLLPMYVETERLEKQLPLTMGAV